MDYIRLQLNYFQDQGETHNEVHTTKDLYDFLLKVFKKERIRVAMSVEPDAHARLQDRMWINQPSTLQKYHEHHGRRVIVDRRSIHGIRVFWLSGDVISQDIDESALSPGWPESSKL